MNKFVLRLLLILATVVVVVVGGFFLLTSGLNAAVKSGVETVSSQATKTPVTLEEVDLSLFSGKGEIRGFTIDNPAGFDTDYAFSLDRIVFSLDVGSLRSDVVVIHEISIDGAQLITEQKLFRKSNLLILLNAVRDFAASAEQTEWDVQFVIEEFHFTNAEITLRAPLIAGQRLDLPDVHVSDIGRPSLGVSVPEMPLWILEPIIAEVLKIVQRRALGL